MENASKALIIAGGILLGIITISLLIYMYNKVGNVVDTISGDTTQEELLEFNKGFEVYNKKIMYGSEIISVINKAIDNNKINEIFSEKNNEYYVDIIVNNHFQLSDYTDYESALIAVDSLSKKTISNNDLKEVIFKESTFRCNNVKYNNYGRICMMEFERYGKAKS